MSLQPIRILSTGVYRPKHLEVLSEDEEAGEGKAAPFGVRTRYRADDGETSSFCASAAITAAAEGHVAKSEIDRVIVASVMPEQPLPTNAVLVAGRLGLSAETTLYDINASCLGFLQAFEAAAHAISTKASRCTAIVAVDIATMALNDDDPETFNLFGDGAAAAILKPARPDEASDVLALHFATHTDGAELCTIKAGGTRFNRRRPPPAPEDYLFAMNGQGLARIALREMPGFLDDLFRRAGVGLSDMACVIPHQASRLGLSFLKRLLGASSPPVVDILADHGNQVSASLPFALHTAIETGQLKRGQLALALGTAAGFSLGGMVFRY